MTDISRSKFRSSPFKMPRQLFSAMYMQSHDASTEPLKSNSSLFLALGQWERSKKRAGDERDLSPRSLLIPHVARLLFPSFPLMESLEQANLTAKFPQVNSGCVDIQNGFQECENGAR